MAGTFGSHDRGGSNCLASGYKGRAGFGESIDLATDSDLLSSDLSSEGRKRISGKQKKGE